MAFDPKFTSLQLETITPSSKWVAKKKNLEVVYKALVRYMRDHCGGPILLADPVNLNDMAEHDDAQQTIKVAGIK